jgi:hypothetical protein
MAWKFQELPTIRDFGDDDSGLDVFHNSGLWQQQFGTSMRTSVIVYNVKNFAKVNWTNQIFCYKQN